jgi:hypothetical protein
MSQIIIDSSLTIASVIKMYFLFGLMVDKKSEEIKIENKVNKYFEDNKDQVKTRSSLNMLRWIYNDGFKLEHFHIDSLYYKKLESVKNELLRFYFSEVKKNDKKINTNEQIHSKIESYMFQVMKLRMIVEPPIQIALNVHTQSKITYLIAKSFWYDENGNKIRKFTKSLGRAEDFKKGVNDLKAKIEAENKIKEVMIQTYEEEYRD